MGFRNLHFRIYAKHWFQRFRRLILVATKLLATGEFQLVHQAIRRRFFSRAVPLAPIEHVHTPPDSNYDVPPLNDDAPIVSVVIPCFNYGAYLERAIDSVVSQTLSDLEIIVVEGGSTDEVTRDIVRNLNRPRTRVVMQNQPTLVGANRNAGIATARGKYVCCLDADDTLDPTFLEKAVYLLESHQYDVVSTGIRFSGARNGTVDVLAAPTLKDMTTGNHVATCAVFSRHIWQSVGGYSDTGRGSEHVAEDWDFWLKVAATGARIRNITGEHLFNYTIHEQASLSSEAGVQSHAKQGKTILKRRQTLLTQEAFARSLSEARRRIITDRPGGRLLAQKPRATLGRRLLIAVPFLIVGGAERLLSTVVEHLSAQGWTITVISTLPQDGQEDSCAWFKRVTPEVYMLPRFLNEWEHKGFVRYLIASRQFDALLIAGSRLVYEMLDEIKKEFRDLAVIDLLFNTVGHAASHLRFRKDITMAIGENQEVIDWLRSTGRPEEQIRLVESGIETARFSQDRPLELACELGIGSRDVVVGFSGRFSSEKGPDIFVEIAESLAGNRNVCFVMTGSGAMKEIIDRCVRKLPSSVRFKLLGMVEDPTPYFALYDIFVIPSRLDGRPIAMLEALSSGCAVVASRVGGIPDVLSGSAAGILCTPGNLDEFTNAVNDLTTNPRKLLEMKTAAVKLARENFSNIRMGDAYLAAIEDAISLSSNTP